MSVRILIFTGMAAAVFASCSKPAPPDKKAFIDIDSLLDRQLVFFQQQHHALTKAVEVGAQRDETRYTPDTAQWRTELELFRQLDQVNKPTFKDAYLVSDARDTNSNLTVTTILAQREAPVLSLKIYFLRDRRDIRKIEAIVKDDNPVYHNDRKLTIELEPVDQQLVLHRYRIEGSQRMVMNDSVRFVIAGEVSM